MSRTDTRRHRRFSNGDWGFVATLLSVGLLLGLTTVPGTFTIDDANHVAAVAGLLNGNWGLPGTEHLPPTQELLWFDPAPRNRVNTTVPAVSTVPPLYAPIALPFSYAGLPGLQWLNVVGVVLATSFVYLLARRYGKRHQTAWIASALFLLGGYVIEYAQGVWAHGVSLAWVMMSAYAAARAREGGATHWAVLAGLAMGVASGVRYQNAAMAVFIGVGIVALSQKRLRNGLAYALGMGVPLALSSLFNHARHGYWNPISKGPGYLTVASSRGWAALPEALHATWDRLVDASSRPAFGESLHQMNLVLPKDPDTGAFFVLGIARKAVLQSSPWFALALVALVLVWTARAPMISEQRRETRAASIVVFGMLAAFAYFGFARTEGWAFNQRYMLELMPIGAICTAWWLERFRTTKLVIGAGALVGGTLTAAVLWAPIALPSGRTLLILTVPVLVAGTTLVLALSAELENTVPTVARFSQRLLPAMIAASLAWAFLVHVGEDVLASRARRESNRALVARVEQVLPDKPVALVVYWGTRDPFGGILLSRDVVLIDTWADEGRSYPEMLNALQAQGRTVFIHPAHPSIIDKLVANRKARLRTHQGQVVLIELVP